VTAIGIATIIGAYFIGGIPIGLLVGLAQGTDIRQYGSGNIGASNVLRTLGAKTGMAVWVADVLKGWGPVYLLKYMLLSPGPWLAGAGLAAVLGHCFSPYLKLAGGRGVSTSLGVLLALDWRVGLSGLVVWAVIVLVTRYISLASISAAASAPVFFALYRNPSAYLAGGIGIALLVIIRHTPNIRRLITGTETRIGEKGRKRSEGSGYHEPGR